MEPPPQSGGHCACACGTVAGVNQPRPSPPAENINSATTPDVAAVLCEASVAHFHRPARPFHRLAFEYTATASMTAIAPAAVST
ncbi:Uncharacterised protein [Mycobacteroides abscessus subsp. abscessus]|nr:Uncharacterised protein [Mycobacteroides abscessus subsp. abscessus]